MRAVSMFSNCGAGDVGFARAGFAFDVLAEVEPRRLAIASANHPGAAVVSGDLRTTWSLVVDRYRARAGDAPPDLLAACPPCQGMSSARGRRGMAADPDAGARDERNLLVVPIAKVAAALRPRVIVVENVPAFLTRLVRDPSSGQPVSAAKLLSSRLSQQYVSFPLVCDLAHYGVPQTRTRAFLTFVRRDDAVLTELDALGLVPYPRPTHLPGSVVRPPVTLRMALGRAGLRPLDARYPHAARDPERPLHAVPVWADHRYPMVAAIPPNSGASAWENDHCAGCGTLTDDREVACCRTCGAPLLRPVVRDVNGEWRLIKGFRSSSYRRMRPDQPASTVTTASGHVGSDSTIHPWENRLLSPLECAELQTFPRSFVWGDAVERHGQTFVRDVIGEAVPPRFTARHGRVLAALLHGHVGTALMRADDARCTRARDRLAG